QLDIGLDLSFFNGRLNLAADYFDKKIDNMLLIVPLPTTLGYPTSPYSNAGNMQNKGWEFELAYNNNIGAFKYSVNGNISAYRNKVTKLGNGEPIFATAHLGEVFTKTEVGMPVGYYYGYVTNGIFQNAKQVEDGPQRETASPGDIRFKDINGDDVIDAKDRTMIGNPWPDFVYGLTMNASYKGFDLSVFFQGSQGNDVMNIQRYDTESGTGYYNATKGFLEKSWSGEGSTDKYHKISQKQGLNNSVSDYFVEDGSYLRVKNVQLGYNFANTFLQKLKMKQFRVYVGAQNLFTVTGYSGLDPEIGSADPKLTGIDQGYYPQARTFMIGINAKF
ncbi:TonB-dependent receptor, partial [Mucilaginibacter sp. 5B2]|nr:TonB-dependent receptor [Mucilaginibacter sp. 5B2]